ncbi:MAG: hypothetical protein D6734_03350 [Candidatus Schekmanbacteria bacterium]|nr:MAG: hypothetical protein D6734_03350 [Candidatus Schekmanbacteria bacterium]
MQKVMNKILIIFPGSLGDFIAFLPSLKLIRAHYPKANIDIACKSSYAPLVEKKPIYANVSERLSFLLSGLFVSADACTIRTKDYLESLDLIITYLDDKDKNFSENLKKNTTAKVLVWKGNIREGLSTNIYKYYLDSLKLLGINNESCKYQIEISNDEEDIPAGNYFCIHPGSGSKRKNWGIRKFVTLAKKIEKNCSLSPIFITGEAETALRIEIPQEFSCIHNEKLKKVSSVLLNSKFYIGNDSGISHLAGTLGIKSFLIFGPTRPEIWAPPLKNVFPIDASKECKKSSQKKDCPVCATSDCLKELQADRVFEIIKENL